MKTPEIRQKLKRPIFYGEIKFFINEKKYGFVTDCENGDEYFFLRKDVALRDENIISHVPVTFSLIEDRDPVRGITIKRAILIRELEL